MPKVAESASAVMVVSIGPCATTAPARSMSTWVNPGGISSTWCDTSTVAGDVGRVAQDAHGVANFDFTNNLAAFNTPVLFITGGLSEVLGASLQTEQVKQYPSATLEVVSGAGHDVAWVKAADVLALIRPYLAARKGGAQ